MLRIVLRYGRPVLVLLARLAVVHEVLGGIALPGLQMLHQKQVTSSCAFCKLFMSMACFVVATVKARVGFCATF